MLKLAGKRVSESITLVLVIMMMAAGLVVPTDALAQGQTVTSQLTGVSITYGPPYELDLDLGYVDDETELIAFLGSADLLAMGFLPASIDLNGARDAMLVALFGETNGSATIDRGNYSGVSYSLDMINIEGSELGVFSLFMNQRSHGFAEFYVFIAPPASFGATMQTAQNSITIDGKPLLDGVDATVMGNLVIANVGITGGTEATNVNDVVDTTTDTTPAPTQVTSVTTTVPTEVATGTTQTDDAARMTYLVAVSFEYNTNDMNLNLVLMTLDGLSKETIAADDARSTLHDVNAELAATNDRIAGIQAPPGMEDFHQQFIAWGQTMTDLGVEWAKFEIGTGSAADYTNALTTAVNVHTTFGDALQAENTRSATSVTETPTDISVATETSHATETPVATESTVSSGGSDEVTTYVTTIQDHRLAFFDSWSTFNDYVGALNDNSTDAEIQEWLQGTVDEAEKWTAYSADASQLTPPSGYDGVQSAYLAWANAITELGNLWIGAINDDGTTTEQFSAQVQVVNNADDDLQAAIAAAEEANGENTSVVTAEVTEIASSTTRTTRTTRSTATETPTESTGSSRTTRPTIGKDLSNTSETSNRTGTTGGNEWFMPLNELTITWDDSFALDDGDVEPTESDPSTGEDAVWLQWEDARGKPASLNVSVAPTSDRDSTRLISQMINDEETVVTFFGEGAMIVDSELGPDASAILVHQGPTEGSGWVYIQVTCVDADCSKLAMVLVVTSDENLPKLLADMEQGIAIEGIILSNAIPVADVQDSIDTFGN